MPFLGFIKNITLGACAVALCLILSACPPPPPPPPENSITLTSHSDGATVGGVFNLSGSFSGAANLIILTLGGREQAAELQLEAGTWSCPIDSYHYADGPASLNIEIKNGLESLDSLSATLHIKNLISGNSLSAAPGWEQDAVFYHIWVKAFANTSASGEVVDGQVGTIAGIRAKLDLLNDGNPATTQDLGVTALWLSPIFDCASKGTATSFNMHGYDSTDYYGINPHFGSKADVENLLSSAHARGIRVIFDFVPNHSSDQHPWFLDSAAKRNGKSDWYLWSATKPNGWYIWNKDPWNNLNPTRNEYYYGIFNGGMPDLNFKNEAVRLEMLRIARYWLGAGFDGMRIDAIPFLYENGSNRWADQEETHAYYQRLRTEVLDSFNSSGYAKMMVGEAWQSTAGAMTYGPDDNKPEFHMNFDFEFRGIVDSAIWGASESQYIDNLSEHLELLNDGQKAGYTMANFLNNHDEVANRVMTDYNAVNKAKLAAALNILGARTPFVYYGDEVGQRNGNLSGDIRLRQPYSWSERASQNADPDSMLSYYRHLIRAKNSYAALRRGSYDRLDSSVPTVFAWIRKLGNEEVVVVTNLGPNQTDAVINLAGKSSYSGPVSVVLGAASGLSSVGSASLDIQDLPASATRVIVLAPGAQVISGSDHTPFVNPVIYLRYAPADDPAPASIPVSCSDSGVNGQLLHDNGVYPDQEAADGVYTGSLTFSQAGDMNVTVDGFIFTFTNLEPESTAYSLVRWEAFNAWTVGHAMYLRGSMNAWGGTKMSLNSSGTWELSMPLTAGTHSYKYCINNGTPWQWNWGENDADGIGDFFGADISFTAASAGTYSFSFNDMSGAYTVSGP